MLFKKQFLFTDSLGQVFTISAWPSLSKDGQYRSTAVIPGKAYAKQFFRGLAFYSGDDPFHYKLLDLWLSAYERPWAKPRNIHQLIDDLVEKFSRGELFIYLDDSPTWRTHHSGSVGEGGSGSGGGGGAGNADAVRTSGAGASSDSGSPDSSPSVAAESANGAAGHVGPSSLPEDAQADETGCIYGGENLPCGGRDSSNSTPYTDPKSFDKNDDPERKPKVSEDGLVSSLAGTNEGAKPKKITKFTERGQVVRRTFKKKNYAIKKNENGFPVFTIFETHLDDSHLGSGDEYAHFRSSNERLAELLQENPKLQSRMRLSDEQVSHLMESPTPSTAPPGLTWHHHEDVGRMQLVDMRLHQRFGHSGGMFVWGGGRD